MINFRFYINKTHHRCNNGMRGRPLQHYKHTQTVGWKKWGREAFDLSYSNTTGCVHLFHELYKCKHKWSISCNNTMQTLCQLIKKTANQTTDWKLKTHIPMAQQMKRVGMGKKGQSYSYGTCASQVKSMARQTVQTLWKKHVTTANTCLLGTEFAGNYVPICCCAIGTRNDNFHFFVWLAVTQVKWKSVCAIFVLVRCAMGVCMGILKSVSGVSNFPRQSSLERKDGVEAKNVDLDYCRSGFFTSWKWMYRKG